MNKSRKITGTNIEIIRSFDGRKLTTVLFDFDGTLSRERDGWVNLMVATNSAALAQAVPTISVKEIVEWVISDIEATIGIPTYQQMKRLVAEIDRRGGASLPARKYKDVYNHALVSMVQSTHQKLSNNELTLEDLRVPGAIDLLTALSKKFGEDNLYLASGTDIRPVQKSVELLGYEIFFGKRIIASGSTGNAEDCAKELIIEKLVKNMNLLPCQLLCFGDGVPEIENTNQFGGVCVGVLTPDKSYYENQGHFTIEQKRERLIKAGAHVLVNDFRRASKLVKFVCSNMLEN